MSVDAIFNTVPVEESAPAPKESPKETRDFGDRIKKGDTNDRISAFGDLVDEDDYGQNDKKGFEPVKVEKDKASISPDEAQEDSESEGDKDLEDKVEDKPVEKKEEVPEHLKKHKTKVDGKEIEVTLAEALADYSGRQALSRRFNEFGKEKQEVYKERDQARQDIAGVQKEVAELKSSFDSVVQEYKKNGFLTKNPMQVVEILLDRMGIDSHDFNRATFEYNLPEYARFFEMDEVQQDAYFAKKENEFLRKKDQTFAERTKMTQAQQARQQQEFNLIKSAGLTVEAYNELFSELEELGDTDISAEKIVEFAKIKPIMDKAGSIVAKTKKAGDVDIIQEVTNLLLHFPTTTEEEITSYINGSSQAEKVVKSLKDKEDFSVKINPKRKSDTDFTDEDDFDMDMFKSMRR